MQIALGTQYLASRFKCVAVPAAETLARAQEIAAALLGEIARRWPWVVWARDSAVVMSWGCAIAESEVRDYRSLGAALARLTANRNPPSIGALLEIATEPVVTEGEARRALRDALAHAARGDWWAMSAAQWQAGCSVGWERLRASRTDDREIAGAWRRALADANEESDSKVCAEQPRRPVAVLPLSDEARAKGAESARNAFVELFKAVGLTLEHVEYDTIERDVH